MIRGKPLLANLIFIARIYQRPEHAVKLARRFHGPIPATVGDRFTGVPGANPGGNGEW